MTQALQEQEIQSCMRELDTLLQEVQKIADPAARDLTGRIIQSMMEFHGAGLGKILDRVAEAGELGQIIVDDLSQDDLVGSLMLLYGMHPLDLESRVRLALDKCRPYLGSHGGNVELVRITEEGAVHLQLQGSCHGCASSTVTLKNTIEQAIYDHAPEVTAIHVAQAEEPATHHVTGFVPIEQLTGRIGNPSLRGKTHVSQ